MVIITKVDFLEVDENPAVYKTYNNVDIISIIGRDVVPSDLNINVKEEYIHGREFINDDGVRTVIGMTKDVSEQLGKPFNVINKLQDSIMFLNHDIKLLRNNFDKELRKVKDERDNIYEKNISLKLKYENMSFWERVAYVFGL